MKKIKYLVLRSSVPFMAGCIACLVALVALAACSTRNPSLRHPHRADALFQPPTIDLEQYQSVHDRPNNSDKLAVAVAISGGGERAGNFGAGVLLGLEEIKLADRSTNALQEVDFFSTVSGGGMAAGAYISALYSHVSINRQRHETFVFGEALRGRAEKLDVVCRSANVQDFYKQEMSKVPPQLTDPCLRRHLERGYHGNILSSFLNPRVLLTNLDRGDMLERTFAAELLGGNWYRAHGNGEIVLGDLFVRKDSDRNPLFPMWFANATALENGAIVPFTPDVFELYKISEYVHNMEEVSRADSSASYSEFTENMPLSLGLTASGNFPSLIAPQTLVSDYDSGTNDYLHLIDGGVSDNLGLHTAIHALRQSPNHGMKRLLIVVDAYPGEFAPYSRGKGGPKFYQVYLKLPDMPLDGLRGRARQMMEAFSGEIDTKVVYLSFDDLYRPSKDDPHTEDAGDVAALFAELENYYVDGVIEAEATAQLATENPEMSPFQIARKVKTSYNITEAEQDFLLAVGKYLVAKNADDIRAALQ